MEEDRIKEIFSRFDPQLSPDSEFMTRMKHNIEAVEMVRRHSALLKKQNRRAVIRAVLCGFLAGILTMFVVFFTGNHAWSPRMSQLFSFPSVLTLESLFILSCIGAFVAVFTSVLIYETSVIHPGGRRSESK